MNGLITYFNPICTSTLPDISFSVPCPLVFNVYDRQWIEDMDPPVHSMDTCQEAQCPLLKKQDEKDTGPL